MIRLIIFTFLLSPFVGLASDDVRSLIEANIKLRQGLPEARTLVESHSQFIEGDQVFGADSRWDICFSGRKLKAIWSRNGKKMVNCFGCYGEHYVKFSQDMDSDRLYVTDISRIDLSDSQYTTPDPRLSGLYPRGFYGGAYKDPVTFLMPASNITSRREENFVISRYTNERGTAIELWIDASKSNSICKIFAEAGEYQYAVEASLTQTNGFWLPTAIEYAEKKGGKFTHRESTNVKWDFTPLKSNEFSIESLTMLQSGTRVNWDIDGEKRRGQQVWDGSKIVSLSEYSSQGERGSNTMAYVLVSGSIVFAFLGYYLLRSNRK